MIFGLVSVLSAKAGGEGEGMLDFARGFLAKYPQFRAEGVMTSTLPGKAPYHCKIAIFFQKGDSVLFSYNTDAVKNIIPYDFAYKDHAVKETIFNRDRTETLQTNVLGAPTRTLFNFVWDLLYEAEHGAGIRNLLLNGLANLDREDSVKGTKIIIGQRIPAGPVSTVTFTFDADQKLKLIEIEQGDGGSHRIEIRKFRREGK